MPPLAFTLALAAAVLHAFWNILLARARDPESATAVALLAAVIVFAPVTALRFDAEWAVWPFIVVTSMLQLLYFALLATAYRKAELSFVYPVARGVAPAIVLVVSITLLGHGTSPAQIVGVVLVGVGVLLVRGLRRPADKHALAFALGIACVIAAYTLLDKRGITHASPVTYLELSMIPAAIGYAGATAAAKGRAQIRAEFGISAVLAGLASSRPTPWSWRRSSVRPPRRSRPSGRRASSWRRFSRRWCCTSASAGRGSPARCSSSVGSPCLPCADTMRPRVRSAQSFVILSPTRTGPGVTTRVLTPRIRNSRPGGLFTNLSASVPKRALNFAQPVCGSAVTSITASPTARRVPAGRFWMLRSRST